MSLEPDSIVPFRTNLGKDTDRWTGLGSLTAKSNGDGSACTLSLADTRPHYLVFAGSDKHFQELAAGAGISVCAAHLLRIHAKSRPDPRVDLGLAVIEFDQTGRRIGATWAGFNEKAVVTLGPNTSYILFAIRLKAKQAGLEVEITDVELFDVGDESRSESQGDSFDAPRISQTLETSSDDRSCIPELTLPDDPSELLALSGIFCQRFYEATAGTQFASLDAAMKHFIQIGMPKMWSCTPLISPALLQEPIKSYWKEGEIFEVLEFFRDQQNELNRLSYFFEPAKIHISDAELKSHPAGSLGYFLSTAQPCTELPTSRGIIRWGDFKATVLRACETRLLEIDRFITGQTALEESPAQEQAMAQDCVPTVSIVLPVDRIDEKFARSLLMIQDQDYGNTDVVVVGDVSASEVANIAGGIGLGESIRVVRKQTTSFSKLRNAGALSATGDYVAFVDSDVLWDKSFLSVCVKKAYESDVDLVYSSLRLRKSEVPWGSSLDDDRQLLHNRVCFGAALIARRVFNKEDLRFDEEKNGSYDHDLALRLRNRIQFEYIASPLARHRVANDEFAMKALYESPSSRFESISRYWPGPDTSWECNSKSKREGVSIVIPMFGNLTLTEAAINAVLENSSEEQFEIILVDNGSPFGTSWTIQALFASRPEIRYVRLPENLNFALGCNYGASFSSMEYVLFLNNDTQVRQGWLRPLVERMEDESILGVQPLLLYPDNSIQSCGTAFVAKNTLPVPFLVNLAPENAVAARNNRYKVLTAAALLVRLKDFHKVGGFDPKYVNGMEDVDFCLRLGEGEARFAVCDESVVMHHESKTPGRGKNITYNRRQFFERWDGKLPEPELYLWREAGLDVAKITSDGNALASPRVSVVRSPSASNHSWGVKYASKGGAAGDLWGDTYFANSLAAAMRRAGLQPFSYRHGANTDYQSAIDRFNLVIRGLDRVAPIPGSVNVLWVISHPEKVTEEEIFGFDIVYAASARWAAKMSEKLGKEIHYLPQATDSSLFNHSIAKDETRRGAVFVGSTHTGRHRRVVEMALASGRQFSVIGRGWEGQLPPEIWESEGVPNERLASVYRSSRYVLADHWPEMAEEGFIQNRIFDAVACGCKVISDQVPGIKEIFGDAVQTYSSQTELEALLSGEGDHLFPSDSEMLEISHEILRNHTFDSRVRQILDDVARVF